MTAHTPGPWFQHPKWRHVCAGGQMDFVVCESPHWMTGKLASDEDLANLRLMAAAPDLLEALEMVRDADDDARADGLRTIPEPARNTIDAALTKATGENA